MKIVIQRVKEASVSVEGKEVSRISDGLVLLVGVEKGDTPNEARVFALKVASMRIFDDEGRKMNLSIKDTGGEVLAVSQFTLCADLSKGKRPSFDPAAPPDEAKAIFADFVDALKAEGLAVKEGVFAAYMSVDIKNDGPVTFIL